MIYLSIVKEVQSPLARFVPENVVPISNPTIIDTLFFSGFWRCGVDFLTSSLWCIVKRKLSVYIIKQLYLWQA